MKKRTMFFLGSGLLLFAVNLFLTFHNDSKVNRTSFVTKWFELGTETLTETFKTEGVVVPATEHPIYYHSEQGAFEGFLVSEGEQVDVGTRLFEYTSTQINADYERLEKEKVRLEQKADSLKGQIKQLEYLQNVTSRTEEAVIAVTIEKEIYDKEQELSELLEEIIDYEDQIKDLDRNGEIDFVSNVRGQVKEINYDLKNPIMTIISDTPIVTGQLSEVDLEQIEEGMSASISSDLHGSKISGTITKIGGYPLAEPHVEQESQFEFQVALAEDSSVSLIHGTHVFITIVTDQVEEAIAVGKSQIDKGSYVYCLTETGKIERRDIEMGLAVGDTVEITSGLEEGETIVTNPNQVARRGEPFITKLDLLKLDSEPFKHERKADLLKAIGVGFSKR